jgi:hypothetical protein
MSIHIDRLMLIKALKITPSKQVINKQSINAGASVTLLPATQYKFAIVLFHGDGDPEVKLSINVDTAVTELMGNEQAIEVLANETIEITATNTSTTEQKSTMTIEILSLAW